MSTKEATARIKINRLLDGAGWRFFADGDAPANIRLEPSVTIKTTDLDALGNNFEKTTRGYIEAEQALVATNHEQIARREKDPSHPGPHLGRSSARRSPPYATRCG